MMTIFQRVAQKDSDALLMQGEQLSSHAQALLIYLKGLPKGQKAQVRKLMLDSADNPSHMRAALAALKGHPAIVFDATGHVFFKHDMVSALVVDAPVVENKPTHNALRVVTRSVSNGSGAVKSQQLNDWLASRTTGACNPTYQIAAGNNH
jgi:hypothetical protein